MISTLLPPPVLRADPAPLLALLTRFAAIGATPGGGVTRLCGSPEDGLARALFREVAQRDGAVLATDEVGNQFARFALTDKPGAPAVMMGSHLDSQVRAGRLDGTLGVAASLCVGAALRQAAGEGAVFDADFIAVNWTNEEGARFRPSLLGSGTYAGIFTPGAALARTDDQGVSLGAALAALGELGTAAPPPPACYVELHIEQGSVLEQAGARIGIVRRNWGALKLDVRFNGEQAHTGPTVMERRRDALLGAAYAISGIRDVAARWPGRVHSSVARLHVEPNSANVVPAVVRMAVEIRADDDALLGEAGALAEAVLADAAQRSATEYEIEARSVRLARALPAAPADLLSACADAAGLPALQMQTVAGHDALSLLHLCPVALVFVPSRGGVTHNEAEDTAPADLAAGFRVSCLAAWRLCRAGGVPEAALALPA